MNHALSMLCTLLLITTAQPSFSRIITSIEDTSLGGGNTITFDNIPLGYLRDNYNDDAISVDGVTFSHETITDNGLTFQIHSITIDGVSFTNGGDTTFPLDPSDAASAFVSIDELALRGESDYLSGNTNTDENHILVQRPRNISELSGVSSGPLNTMKVTFNTPVTAFGLEFGGNQSPRSQSVQVYNTSDELIATLPHNHMGLGYETLTLFYGYSIDSDTDEKISYLKCGNMNTADSIWVNNVTYTNRTVFFANLLWDRRLWLISILIIPVTIFTYRRVRRHKLTNRHSKR